MTLSQQGGERMLLGKGEGQIGHSGSNLLTKHIEGIRKDRNVMNKFLYGLLGAFALSVTYAFLGGDTELLGQQIRTVKETIRLKEHPLKFDKDLGAAISRIGEGRLRQIDATLVEIPAGGELVAHRHLAEEMIYIVSGKGYTLMWTGSEGMKERYEWREGDLLSPSLNAWHQHFNASSDTPARYLSLTTSPLTQNLFKNRLFLSSTDFIFANRWREAVVQKPQYVGEAAPASCGMSCPENVRMNVGHLLPNLPGREMLHQRENALGITILPEGDMAGNQLLEMEVREFLAPSATSPNHRHLWEVVYVILKGEGYSLMQREGEPERRLEWSEGDMFIVEANEYHNHRPRATGRPSFLQMKASGYFRRVGIDEYLMQNKPTR